jgi:hypothetical protein
MLATNVSVHMQPNDCRLSKIKEYGDEGVLGHNGNFGKYGIYRAHFAVPMTVIVQEVFSGCEVGLGELGHDCLGRSYKYLVKNGGG